MTEEQKKEFEKEIIIFNEKRFTHNKKKQMLDDIDEFDSIPLPSSIISNTKKHDQKVKEKEEEKEKNITNIDNTRTEEDDDDDWLSELAWTSKPSFKKTLDKKFSSIEDECKNSKKKKKKKSEDDVIQYDKQFGPELTALKNLHVQQSKFIHTLQGMYDEMASRKSTTRGIGKFTIDLANAISASRSTDLSIIDRITSTKKTIAELNIKERKEFGKKTGAQEADNAAYASTFLSNLIGSASTAELENATPEYDNTSVGNISNDDDINFLIDGLEGNSNRSSDVDKYLKYENDNVETKIHRHNNGDWEFVAYNSAGDIVPDYPLPIKGEMTFNDSTHLASDPYNRDYQIIDVE